MAKTNKEATMMKGGRAGNYPSFKVTKNIRVDDEFITTGTYNYTGKERGGKGVYMNDSNYQTAGFDLDKLNMLKSRFPDSIEMIMKNGGMTDEKRAEKQRLDEQMKRLREARQSRNKKIIGMQEKLHQDAMRKKMMSKGGEVDVEVATEFFTNDGIGEKYVSNNKFDEALFRKDMETRLNKSRSQSLIKMWSRGLGMNPSKYIDGEIIENIDFVNDSTKRAKHLFSLTSKKMATGGGVGKKPKSILFLEEKGYYDTVANGVSGKDKEDDIIGISDWLNDLDKDEDLGSNLMSHAKSAYNYIIKDKSIIVKNNQTVDTTITKISNLSSLRDSIIKEWADKNKIDLSMILTDLKSKKITAFDLQDAVLRGEKKYGKNYSKEAFAKYSKMANGGGVEKYDYDYEDIGQFSVADSEWKNYSQEDFRRMGKKIVKEKYNGDLTRAYNSVVRKNKMETGGEVGKTTYTVAGRPVTLNKGQKENGTDWTVTFLSNSSIGRKGEEIPLSDVLALIKPFPKGIKMMETGGGVDSKREYLENRLWNERGYDYPFLNKLSLKELRSLYDTEFYYDETYAKGGGVGKFKYEKGQKFNDEHGEIVLLNKYSDELWEARRWSGMRHVGDVVISEKDLDIIRSRKMKTGGGVEDLDYGFNPKDLLDEMIKTPWGVGRIYEVAGKGSNQHVKIDVDGKTHLMNMGEISKEDIVKYATGGGVGKKGRYHILGALEGKQPVLYSATDDKNEISKLVKLADKDFFDLTAKKHKIFVTDSVADEEIYHYGDGGKVPIFEQTDVEDLRLLIAENYNHEVDGDGHDVAKAFNRHRRGSKAKYDPSTDTITYIIDYEEKDDKMATGGSVENKFCVVMSGGSIGERGKFDKKNRKLVEIFDTKEQAASYAKRNNSQLSPGEKKYYGIRYYVAPYNEKDFHSRMAFGGMVNDLPEHVMERMDGLVLTNELDRLLDSTEVIIKDMENEGFEKDETLSFLAAKMVETANNMYRTGGYVQGDDIIFNRYDEPTEGTIHEKLDDGNFVVYTDNGVILVEPHDITGHAKKRMFGIFENGGNVAQGAAHVYVVLENGNIKVYHGDDRKSLLFEKRNAPAGSWEKIWECLRKL